MACHLRRELIESRQYMTRGSLRQSSRRPSKLHISTRSDCVPGREVKTDSERFVFRCGVPAMLCARESTHARSASGGRETAPDCVHVVVDQLAVTTEQLVKLKLGG